MFAMHDSESLHPDVIAAQNCLENLKKRMKHTNLKLRHAISKTIYDFGKQFKSEESALTRGKKIEKGGSAFSTTIQTINYINQTADDIEELFKSFTFFITEYRVNDLVRNRSELLGGLIHIRTEKEKENWEKWKKHEALTHLKFLLKSFRTLLQEDLFSEESALQIHSDYKEAEEGKKKTETRVEEELRKHSRLKMSTIGSSHKMIPTDAEQSNRIVTENLHDSRDITELLDNLSLNSNECEEKSAVVIFDESGCIPEYELLGLGRIVKDISSIVLVGDIHQLPPYDPSDRKKDQQRLRHGRTSRIERSTSQKDNKIKMKSLLHVSKLKEDNDTKIFLTKQYRVPKDIAEILNSRIYKGLYKTVDNMGIPHEGLKIVHVPLDRKPRRKYVNSFEVEKGLSLLRDAQRKCIREISALVITPVSVHMIILLFCIFSIQLPCIFFKYSNRKHTYTSVLFIGLIKYQYKNQQREFEFQLKKADMDHYPVLTIDQCQGQEADLVILSLVQKPTSFLTKNRLNVALSRVRKRLYILVDVKEFKSAAKNSRCGSSFIINDLIDYCP